MHFSDDSELIHDLEYVTTLLMAPEIRHGIADAAASDVTEVVVLDDTGPGLGDYIVERNRRIDQALEALQKIFGN